MEKIVQCDYCKEKVNIEEAFYEEKEAPLYNPKTKETTLERTYYHHKCYQKIIDDEVDRYNLIQTIKEIHHIGTIPPFFYTKNLEELRKKQGYSYKNLEKGYKLAEKKINQGISYNNITDKVSQLYYGYKCAVSYIEISSKKT